MSLGNRLKQARNNKGLTQKEAAKKLKITFQALSNYERDYRDPDTGTLTKMAGIYGVTTDYLLGRTDNPSPAPATKRKVTEKRSLPGDVPIAFYGNTDGIDIEKLEEIINRAVKKALAEREKNKKE